MSVHWFVDTSLPGNAYETAKELGIIATKNHDDFALKGEPFIYGPISFVRKKSVEVGYGSYINPVTMSVSGSYPFVDKGKLLNPDYILIPFGTLRNDYERFLDMFGGSFFLRGNSATKTIPGQVINSEDVAFEMNSIRQLSSAVDDTICVLASKKDIIKEYRLFMAERTFLAGSSYSWDDAPYEPVPTNVITFASEIAAIWQPEAIYTIDIADTPEGLKLVEFNSASSSGLYGANVRDFVTGITNYLKNI